MLIYLWTELIEEIAQNRLQLDRIHSDHNLQPEQNIVYRMERSKYMYF